MKATFACRKTTSHTAASGKTIHLKASAAGQSPSQATLINRKTCWPP